MYCVNLFLFQSSLHIEVWDGDDWEDDAIDNFTIPLSVPLDRFNLSHSLTLQGKLGILTLNYGNLTTHPTTCPATIEPTLSSCSCTEEVINYS